MAILRRVILKGFKSIKSMDLELRPLNVLIGANGAGKSNLISFFKMLNEMIAGRLQQYVGTSGRAQSLLHFGPKHTTEIEARLEFKGVPDFNVADGTAAYVMRLIHAVGDSLIYAEETLLKEEFQVSNAVGLGSGHAETHIGQVALNSQPMAQQLARTLEDLLNRCRVYHFHDTSPTARIRQYCYIGNNRWLMPDAGNLAAFLLRLREENRSVYDRVVSTIRLLAPFFIDFSLEPAGPHKQEIILNWLEDPSDLHSSSSVADSEQVFGPHQLSDGTLRAMCLVTLLMQPENELPDLIIVDEPELGLHPYALNLVASLFKRASHHCQVVISTQSSTFLNNFDAEDVIVVSRLDNESQFIRPDPDQLAEWLDEYSLGEVWEKNVIGGGPH